MTKTVHWAAMCAAVVVLAGGCGGGNPLDNPPPVSNTQGESGQRLSFLYFQRCINPIFLATLPILGTATTNTCAGSGCHADASGTGGAFRVIPGAQEVDITLSANTPDVIRTTDMYKNFYSARGEAFLNAPEDSRLLTKPLVEVLHGGGPIFPNRLDPNVRLIQYWISHPMPQGQDEFSNAAYNMFTPPYDPLNPLNPVACNTQ